MSEIPIFLAIDDLIFDFFSASRTVLEHFLHKLELSYEQKT